MVYKIFTILSGIYAFLGGLIWCLMGIALMFAPAAKDANDPAGSNMVMIAFFLFLGLMLIAIAVGLFMRKNWARTGLMIFSCFVVMMGGVLILASIFIVKPSAEIPREALIALEIFDGIFGIAIPLFFLMFFNSRPVKALFAGQIQNGSANGADPGDGSAPFGIKFLAVYYFFSVFSLLLGAGFTSQIKEIPLIVNVLWVSGAGLKIYYALITLLHVYLGYGFFKLWRNAWKAAMWWNGSMVLLGFYNILNMSPAYWERVIAHYPAESKFVMSFSQHRSIALVSIICIAAVTYYIYRNKKHFVN